MNDEWAEAVARDVMGAFYQGIECDKALWSLRFMRLVPILKRAAEELLRRRWETLPGMMTEERVSAIASWAEGATPGPWLSNHMQFLDDPEHSPSGCNKARDEHQRTVDCVFAADAREAVPELLAERERLMRVLMDDRLAEWAAREVGRREGIEEAARYVAEVEDERAGDAVRGLKEGT